MFLRLQGLMGVALAVVLAASPAFAQTIPASKPAPAAKAAIAAPAAPVAKAAAVAPAAKAVAAPASAEVDPNLAEKWPMRWDIGLGLGYNMLDSKGFLGDAYYIDNVPASSVLIALRGTAWILDQVGVEVEAKYVPTEIAGTGHVDTGANPETAKTVPTDVSMGATVWGVRALAVYDILPKAVVRPLVSAGLGMEGLSVSEDTAVLQKKAGVRIANDSDFSLVLGAGASWQAVDRLHLRFDLRYVGSAPIKGSDALLSTNFEAVLAVAYTLGGKPGDDDMDGILNPFDKCPEAAEDKDAFEDRDGCPDPDNDGDKVVDAEDKCPNDAEDMDTFEDYDGCPELDNDKDGVLDAKDKCPIQAEDKDGFQDNDGCADLDNDADGMPDAQDKCRDQAEDKDGFQDEDGCPDIDNDGDAISDASDKCPSDAETRNGYQDGDGCPDQIPEALVKLTAAPLTGVTFKDVVLVEKTSGPALQPIAEALTANEGVAIVIKLESTTVDQVKAQARADAIKNFLVSRGIEMERIDVVATGTAAPVVVKKGRPAPPDRITVQLR
jgi:opacity protein-like surface antigen